MINSPYWEVSESIQIEINGNAFNGKVCDLPFI